MGMACGTLQKKIGIAIFAIALALVGKAHASAIVPIDTLPNTPSGYLDTFAHFEWHDLAVGFTVPTAGTIKRIQTSLYAHWGFGNFTVGLASNDLIGNPAAPTYFTPPPGSIKEYTVCSTFIPWGTSRSPCDEPSWGDSPSYGGDYQLDPNQPLEIVGDIFLPSGGTYWLYTRYEMDTVFNAWGTNNAIQTDLVATRVGFLTNEYPGQEIRSIDDRTFYRVQSPQSAPGLRIEFEPGLRLPIPSTALLFALGSIGLLAFRTRTPRKERRSGKAFSNKLIALLMFSAAFILATKSHASAVVPIDTLPTEPGGRIATYAHFQWVDLAVGFTVPTAGTIKRIQTSFYTGTAVAGFFVGVASNELVSSAWSVGMGGFPPPGSIVDYKACASRYVPDLMRSVCDSQYDGGGYELAPGEALEIAEDIFLPSGGTYWVYIRHPHDFVFNYWETNNAITTDLIAIRSGPGENYRQFVQVQSPQNAPGIRVEFAPGLRLPIPSTGLLFSLGGIALLVFRSRTNGSKPES